VTPVVCAAAVTVASAAQPPDPCVLVTTVDALVRTVTDRL
jgi:hypothetical protein